MSSVIQKKENSRVTFEMTVDSKIFDDAVSKAYRKVAQKVNIPGFRKGKAPKKLIELHYGEGIFFDDAIEILFPSEYEKSITELSISPIDRPTIDVVEIGEGKNLVLKVEVDVTPEPKVNKYKGLEIKKVDATVGEKDIEDEINSVIEKNARIETAEGKEIEKGSIAVINFEGFVDDVPFEGGKADNYELEIGSGTFIAGFEDQLIGKKAEEETEVNVTFPNEYHVKELEGKAAKFKVKVLEVKNKILPELDDEFVKDISEFDTVEEYKNSVKENLQKRFEQSSKIEEENMLLDALLENVEVEVPNSLVENQINNMINQFRFNLYMQGLELEQYLQMTGMDMEKLRVSFRSDAEKDVKVELALIEIQKAENLSVSNEELEEKIAEYAKSANQTVEDYKKNVEKQNKNYLDNISYNILRNKTISILRDNATITE